jgi:hypothetical protein
MKFALLYQYDPTTTGPTDGEIQDWFAFDKRVRDAGIFVYEAGFHAAADAQTISVRDGSATVTNGVVDTTGDVPAGLYVIDVTDLDTATKWSEQVPTARYGTVVVRQIVEYAG